MKSDKYSVDHSQPKTTLYMLWIILNPDTSKQGLKLHFKTKNIFTCTYLHKVWLFHAHVAL